MKLKPKTTIEEHFSAIEDPRIDRTKLHQLIDIITITLCAVISGAESWNDIELFGQCKYDWFKSFLELPNGIPTHDTFARVFARIDPTQLEKCFSDWVKSINDLLAGEQVAIDGKTLRHSYDRGQGQKAIVMVSAWARNSGLVLAQRKVSEKSNEITAVPELLKVLELSGAIVTLDAMGCQKKTVNQIISQEADYLICLKQNQGSLYTAVDKLFQDVLSHGQQGYEYSTYSVDNLERGRTENRHYQVLNNISKLVDTEQEWSNLNSVVQVSYLRQLPSGKTSLEIRYFITSLSHNAEKLADYIRGHWSIENQLHWVLDVGFHEDDSRIRKDNAPENLAIIRHIALNLLKQDKSSKSSIKGRRKKAGWDNSYLRELLLQ